MTTTAEPLFTADDLISSYSRAQALEDGELVDVSEAAAEAGIRFPVALTRAVYESCVAWTREAGWQDESGRLWDVVWMARCAIVRSRGTDRIAFRLLVVPNHGRSTHARTVDLIAHCGPGDTAEPVITIMLPTES